MTSIPESQNLHVNDTKVVELEDSDGTNILVDPLEPNDLSHLSDEEFLALSPQGFHAP